MRAIDKADLRAPALVIDLDLDADAAAVTSPIEVAGYETLWCLARYRGEPLGVTCWEIAQEGEIDAADLRQAVVGSVGAPGDQRSEPEPANDDSLTIAICTRDRSDSLKRALASLHDQSDPDFAVIVVDNAPTNDDSRDVVEAAGLPRCRYVVEPRGGLSRARNAALAHVDTELVAWLDDDERADRDWIRQIREGFAHESKPDAVCGLMLPAELESEAQVRFEQYGGFNKGRGFVPEVLSVAVGTVRSPMYPLPSFGAGGNMTFRTEALRQAGSFDPLLGPGTRTRNGEETRALAMILWRRGTVLHWPAAITWHYHRRSLDELHAQLLGYGAGLSAFFVSVLVSERAAAVNELLRLVPKAIRDMWPKGGNIRTGMLPADFPADLASAPRRGFLHGGPAYVRELRAARADRRSR